MAKDYYNILGLTKDERKLHGKEFDKVLKKKFRELSVKWHPDRNNGSKEAEAKFKEIAEAYNVLGDEVKRKEYDNPKTKFEFNGGGGSGPDFSKMSMDDILRHFNDLGGFGFGGRQHFHQQRRKDMGGDAEPEMVGSHIRIKVKLTLEEVLNGCTKKVRLKKYVKCDKCNGTGMTNESKRKTCKTCGGTGMAFSQNMFMSMHHTCPTCGGRGHVIENPCSKCHGHGIMEDAGSEVTFTIPKGVESGMQIEYKGLGNSAPHGKGRNGNLIVLVEYEEHPVFDVSGRDVVCDLEVSAVDAMLGCEIEVGTLGGKKIKAKIPGGTCSGKVFRFKGYGLPLYGINGQKGNMVGIVTITTPPKLNDRERKLLEELKKEEHFRQE